MQHFKILFVLLLYVASTIICYAQKNTVALVDARSFYDSENTITRLVDALKIANPKFSSLTSEEKNEEFGRIAKKCQDTKDGTTKNTTTALATNEEVVCVAIKDIVQSVQEFKKKQGFSLLVDIGACSYVTHICEAAVDVTKQFVSEYNNAQK